MRRIQEIELAGQNYTLKLNNLAIANAEKQLGKSINTILQEGMGVESMHTLLWLALKSYEPKLKLKEVYELVENAVDEDPAKYQEIMELLLDMILGALGLGAEEAEKKPQAIKAAKAEK